MITAKKLTDQQIYALLRNERKLSRSLTTLLKQEIHLRGSVMHNKPDPAKEKTFPLLHRILIALFAPLLFHPQVYPLLIVFTALTAWLQGSGRKRMAMSAWRMLAAGFILYLVLIVLFA